MVDLPAEDFRAVLADATSQAIGDILEPDRRRLDRNPSRVATQIAVIDDCLEKGLCMTPATDARPAQLKIAVDDIDEAIAFYEEAFGFHYDVVRRTDDAEYASFVFSKYGERDFFLMHLLDETAVDRPGPATFGLIVGDLNATHAKALAAGATEVIGPHDAQGMPRNSAVKDPSGNWIWLYQD
jgi:predicted enzyme related to lactoylglutathione lyase